MNDVVLALGGGGVKGYAHIGVIRQLERAGFHIRAIAGTSAGGLVGSVYAAGYHPDEIENTLSAMDQNKLYQRLPQDGPSMLGLAGVVGGLKEMLGDSTFAELLLPFAVTAVNLETAHLVTLQEGNVLEAVLATIAVPGVFPPRQWQGQSLIDGGVLDPVPVGLARQLAPGLPVVAVVLSPPMEDWKNPIQPRLLHSLPFLSTYLGRLRVAQALNIFLRSIDIAGMHLTEMRLQIDQPEVILRPKVPHIGLLDPVDIHEVAKLGEEVVQDEIDALRQAVGWRAWVTRQVERRIGARRIGPHAPGASL